MKDIFYKNKEKELYALSRVLKRALEDNLDVTHKTGVSGSFPCFCIHNGI